MSPLEGDRDPGSPVRISVSGLVLSSAEPLETLPRLAAERLGFPHGAILSWRPLLRSLDARGRGPPRFVCRVGLVLRPATRLPELAGVSPWPAEPAAPAPLVRIPAGRPIVVGTGPAGLFAALRLAERGVRPILLERGDPVEARVRRVASYWRRGELDPDCNVQFGEGGAGTFSDGKLTYRGRDPRRSWVFESLVAAGAPEEILFEARPHLGTDRLRRIVGRIRQRLQAAGCEVHFRTRVEDLIVEGGRVAGVATTRGPFRGASLILAVGHSACDLVGRLVTQGAAAERKGFAVGFRMEMQQDWLDRNQYGRWAGEPGLPPAEFSVKARGAHGRDVYSFCMCPGGTVIPAGTDGDGLVVNGMSSSGRRGPWANAAVVAAVEPADLGNGTLSGYSRQREWERMARGLGGERGVPAQRVRDFVAGRLSRDLPRSSCPWRPVAADLAACVPDYVAEALRSALPRLARQVRPIEDALLLGVESRTSSPVRLVRGDDLQSPGLPGLYPVGEGAGYAGGIVSAAIDGARAADAWTASLGPALEREEGGSS